MLGHPLLDGPEDIFPAFTHNSDDYILYDCTAQTEPPKSMGTTYRPISIASLIVVNALIGTRPFAHHLFSLFLHLVVVGLVWVLASRLAPARRWSAFGCSAIFALHPALGEAYLWINARSDLIAAVALVCWGLALDDTRPVSPRTATQQLRGVAVAFTVCTLGFLSKETFIPAAAAVWLASHLPDSLPVRRYFLVRFRSLAPETVGAAIALITWVTLRARALPHATIARNLDWLSVHKSFWDRAARLVAHGLENSLIPAPRAMDSLAWHLTRSWTVSEAILLSLFTIGLLTLLARRYWRTVVLLVGAVITLLPSGLVADFLWFGFDRYLYLPAILAYFALAPWVLKWVVPWLERRVRAAALGGILATIVCGMAAATFATAHYYQDEQAFVMSMVEARPFDPSPYLYAAGRAITEKNYASAGGLLDAMPTDHLPAPLIITAVDHYRRIGMGDKAGALVEQFHSLHPQDPYGRFAMLGWLSEKKRYAEALQFARMTQQEPGFCRVTNQALESWDLALTDHELREQIQAVKRTQCKHEI